MLFARPKQVPVYELSSETATSPNRLETSPDTTNTGAGPLPDNDFQHPIQELPGSTPLQPIQNAQPTQPVQPVQPAEPVQSIQPIQPPQSPPPPPHSVPDLLRMHDMKAYPQPQYPSSPPQMQDLKGYPSPSQNPQGPYQGLPGGYYYSTPLHALQSTPGPVDCPVCGQREVTRAEAVSGNTTHAWAALLCVACCLGCIPYLMTSLKDVNHYCAKCGTLLAAWHNSGRVDVLQQYQRPQQMRMQTQTQTPIQQPLGSSSQQTEQQNQPQPTQQSSPSR